MQKWWWRHVRGRLLCGFGGISDADSGWAVREGDQLMINNDFPYTEVDVLAVEIADEADLKEVLSALLEAEINIHYVYSFIKRPDGKSALAMNIEDMDVAAQSLNTHGFKVLTQRDISR